MLNFTHMLVGAAIASRVDPALGLPLAFVSHFALDAIPHYDGFYPVKPYRVLPLAQLLLDFLLGVFLLALFTNGREDQNYLVIAALVAIIPDIQAGLHYNYQLLPWLKPLVTFHVDILQAYKPPIWAGVLTTILVTFAALKILGSF